MLLKEKVTGVGRTRKDLSILEFLVVAFLGLVTQGKPPWGKPWIICQVCIWTSSIGMTMLFLAGKQAIIKKLANVWE